MFCLSSVSSAIANGIVVSSEVAEVILAADSLIVVLVDLVVESVEEEDIRRSLL